MPWIIKKDRLAMEPSDEGRSHGDVQDENKLTEHFHLFDADGILYYEGIRTPDDDTCLDWAMNNAGCTELQIFEDGVWQTVIG